VDDGILQNNISQVLTCSNIWSISLLGAQ